MPPRPLHPPSAEQVGILDAVRGGNHVLVAAVAGSGKTTSVLHLAKDLASRGQRALLLTYNARLKDETRSRRDAAGLAVAALEVHSFHACGVKYWSDACATDSGLRRVCARELGLRAGCTLPAWNVVVIDEAQDVTPLLFGFVCRLLELLRQRGQQPQLVVLGDARQAIYGFKSSDARFLTLSPQVWPVGGPWVSRHLRTSYRVSPACAVFVNQCLLGQPWMDAAPSAPWGEPVQYWVGSPFTVASRWAAEIHDLVSHQGVRPDEVFVLAPSLLPSKTGNDTPLARLLRELQPLVPKAGQKRIPVHLPKGGDDLEHGSEHLSRGSLAVSTYHQAKGRERRYVYALGWSGDWFQYYGRNVPVERRGTCTNEHYTCATRAITRLSLCAEKEPREWLPFVKRGRVFAHSRPRAPPSPPPCVRIIYCGDSFPSSHDSPFPPPSMWATEPAHSDPPDHDVTSLLRHLSGTLVDWCVQQLAPQRIAPVADEIDLPLEVPAAREYYDEHKKLEAVSDLVGLVIPALLEAQADGIRSSSSSSGGAAPPGASGHLDFARLGDCTIATAIAAIAQARTQSGSCALQVAAHQWGQVPRSIGSVADALKLAALYDALSTNYDTRLKQLPPSFDWLSPEQVDRCMAKLRVHVRAPEACHFEVQMRCKFRVPHLQQLPPGSAPESVAAAAVAAAMAAAPGVDPATGAPEFREFTLSGIADVVTDDGCLLELKVVNQLGPEHVLQLALYATCGCTRSRSSRGAAQRGR